MKTVTTELDEATISRVSRNLNLAGRFTLAAFNDPSILDDIPDNGEIVLIPDDDPELAESNLRGGMRSVREGKNITFHHIRAAEYPKLPKLGPVQLIPDGSQ
jgi:hypothetical protein